MTKEEVVKWFEDNQEERYVTVVCRYMKPRKDMRPNMEGYVVYQLEEEKFAIIYPFIGLKNKLIELDEYINSLSCGNYGVENKDWMVIVPDGSAWGKTIK